MFAAHFCTHQGIASPTGKRNACIHAAPSLPTMCSKTLHSDTAILPKLPTTWNVINLSLVSLVLNDFKFECNGVSLTTLVPFNIPR